MKIKNIGIGFIMLLVSVVQLFASGLMADADSLFELRNTNFDTEKMLADSNYVNKSIALYQQIIDNSADSVAKHEAIWKILRAYYFKGLFITSDTDLRSDIYWEGIEFGEKYVQQYPESVAINCWLGVLWGYWGEVNSKIASARKGVPGKVKYYAEKTIELDENYLDAGGYRMFGRLHFKVPKIPLIMGWPSRKKSQEYLEKAHKMAPENLFNKLYLAEVLLDQKQEDRAFKLLNEIINTRELKHGVAADTFIKHQAQILLNSLRIKM